MSARLLSCFTLLAISATAAQAVSYADFDQINDPVSVGNPVTGYFDLTLPAPENDGAFMQGYPGSGNGWFQDIDGFETGMAITGASVSLWLSDPLGGKEVWNINLLVESGVDANNQVTFEQALSTGGGSFSKYFQATGFQMERFWWRSARLENSTMKSEPFQVSFKWTPPC